MWSRIDFSHRDMVDAAEMITGGVLAAAFFEAFRELNQPLHGPIEMLIGVLFGVVGFLLAVTFAAIFFSMLEQDARQPSVNLTEDAIDEIAEKIQQQGGENE